MDDTTTTNATTSDAGTGDQGTGGPSDAAGAAAGAAAIGAILTRMLQEINLDREIAIAISNFTSDNKLKDPKYYIESGKIVDAALTVDTGKAEFVSASKTSGAATGSVAVITYQISHTSYRLAILWSVPFDYNLYENVFNFKIVDAGTATDVNLYNDMYNGAAKATDGAYKVTDKGFKVKGTMGTGGQATLNISFKTDS